MNTYLRFDNFLKVVKSDISSENTEGVVLNL